MFDDDNDCGCRHSSWGLFDTLCTIACVLWLLEIFSDDEEKT